MQLGRANFGGHASHGRHGNVLEDRLLLDAIDVPGYDCVAMGRHCRIQVLIHKHEEHMLQQRGRTRARAGASKHAPPYFAQRIQTIGRGSLNHCNHLRITIQ